MSLAADPPQNEPLSYPLPGRVSFGWITESWQLFMANVGVWIVAVLALAALPVVVGIVVYAAMLTSMFPGGFPPAPGMTPHPPPWLGPQPGSPAYTPGANPFLISGFREIFSYEIAASLVMMVYFAFFYGSLFRMAVRQVRGLPVEVKDVFRGGPLFGRMLGAAFLLAFGAYGLEFVVALPLILLSHFQPQNVGALIGTGVATGLVLFGLIMVAYGLLLPALALMADGDGVFTALRRSVRGMKAQWLPATGFVFVFGLLFYASYLACLVGLLATVPMVFLICALAYRDLIGMPNMVPRPAPGYPPFPPPPAPGTWPPPPGAASYPSPEPFPEPSPDPPAGSEI